jgi:hypothetical protein
METDTEKIKKIEEIFQKWGEIPCECFSDIYNIAELDGDLIDKIRQVIKGDD